MKRMGMNDLRKKIHIAFQNTYCVCGALVSAQGSVAHVCADASFRRRIPNVAIVTPTTGVRSITRRFIAHTRGARAHASTPVLVQDRVRRTVAERFGRICLIAHLAAQAADGNIVDHRPATVGIIDALFLAATIRGVPFLTHL